MRSRNVKALDLPCTSKKKFDLKKSKKITYFAVTEFFSSHCYKNKQTQMKKKINNMYIQPSTNIESAVAYRYICLLCYTLSNNVSQ